MDERSESFAAAEYRVASILVLVLAGLVGLVAVIAAAWLIGREPQLDTQWQVGASGRIELAADGAAGLDAQHGKPLVGLRGLDGSTVAADPLLLHRSPRWLVEDTTRERHAALHRAARAAHAQPTVTLLFGDGSELALPVQPRGIAALGGAYWLLNGVGLLLYLAVVFALLTRRSTVNLLFAIASLCQLGNLALSAVESTQGLGLHPLLSQWDLPARMAFDLVTAATAVHGASLLFPPARAAGVRRLTAGTWIAVAALVTLAARGDLAGAWWWSQGGVAALCLLAILLLHRAEQVEPHPVAGQLRRIGSVVLGTWLLLTVALAASQRWPVSPQPVSELAATVWYVCLASLLLLMPFFLRGQQLLREFALLAAIGTIAVSLNLLLVALFALGQLPSMALSLVLSLALYAASRQWILDRLLGSGRLTTERMFDQLYRIAREVEAHPRRVPALLLQLLRELFEPLQAEAGEGPAPPRTQVEQDGTVLTVPIASLAGERDGAPASLQLRHAQRGRRIFTREDARLADRIVEQLRRAVVFDHAVEQGRREERLRLAQDLHDDIGARLLTLMYKAPTPELEEYVRHTLKDLKTLTRGLAASGHTLGDAAAEWKADLTQRLTAADIELGWSFGADREFVLGVVQWSALTRIIRELVSNAIAHARATRVDVTLELAGGTLALCVADDGVGVEPRTWSHGLGISGVRKRVKQLDGEVRWDAAAGGGVACRVRIQLRPVSD